MLALTTAEQVRTLLRIDAADPDAARVEAATVSANVLVTYHLFADNAATAVIGDLTADEQHVAAIAAQLVARELIARPVFGVVDTEAAAMFMSSDPLAGVRGMLAPIRGRLGHTAVDFGV